MTMRLLSLLWKVNDATIKSNDKSVKQMPGQNDIPILMNLQVACSSISIDDVQVWSKRLKGNNVDIFKMTIFISQTFAS